ncbi:MAG: GGDEF domain-containing protein [Proteobacteria bacterium]|nr:GGDEF domain-containing protein [Pseudomonadota bacterium]NDC23122.1 GGDEF domain-containing protein [Pseudomonadota bacterium]NDD03923.1 GGDEF domain-containing protein [Pseudomonadota bacterium]NDG26028.1 GGDEF domain-containing protein [Pseudomonadota bacterium]
MAKPPKTGEISEPQEPTKTALADGDTLKIRLEEAKSIAPTLVVISGKPLGKSFYLTKERIVLGRDLAADINIGETAISRKHTEFYLSPSGVQVRDLGSTNGTFVNDVKIEKDTYQNLNDGDLVRCGGTLLKFLKEGKIENIHYGKMYDLATLDDLTQTFNKKAILDILGEEFARSIARSTPFTLVMFDIDHFKQTNDNFGHLAGDYVLKEVCHLIKTKLIRGKDSLGRYGGEEFALLLPDTPLQIAVDIAERIRSTIEKTSFRFDNRTIPVTISLGVSSRDSTTKSHGDLLASADKALYDAKNQGRNRVCVR